MSSLRSRLTACSVAMFAACSAAGGIADKILVWGYVLDKTPTACPFVFGKTDYSLERAAAEFGFNKAMYMNSCFNQEYLDKNFQYWDRECFENCVDNRLKDVQLEKLRGLDEVWCATTHGDKMESSIAIAKMSLKYPNIVGVNFDDFNGNNATLGMSVEKMRELKAAMRAINPKLKISVVSYVKDANETDFDLTPYRGEIDHVSRWKWVTETNYWYNLRADIAELRRQVGPKAKIVHGLYIHNFAKDMKCPEALPLDYFKLSASAALAAVADGTLDGIVLPQIAWYSMPTHREHFDWFLRQVRAMDREGVKYWVDNVKGDDSADGTRERPFRTLARAAAAMRAGDEMHLVANAEPYREALKLDGRFSKMSAPDGARKTVIDGHGAAIDGLGRRPMGEWRDEGRGVWSSKQNNNAWTMNAQGYWSGHPIVFRDGKPLAWRKSLDELETNTYLLRKVAKPKTPEEKDAHNRLYVKLAEGEKPDQLEVPVRGNGMWIDGVSNLVVRNLTAMNFFNDGFDTYWRKGIEFENVRGAYNMDQGISAHSSEVTVRRSRFDHNAGCGAVDCCPGNDGHLPRTVYEDCVFDSQSFRGGAEFLNGYFTLRRCKFVESPGVAVTMRGCRDFEISDCVFSNSAVKARCAIWLNGLCTGRVDRCEFSGFKQNVSAAKSCRID